MEQALEYLPQAQAVKERQKQTLATAKRAKVAAPRTSTTDPEARVMKMPDGGFRPAYNMQLATDQAQGVIVGVSSITEGTDAGQALPIGAGGPAYRRASQGLPDGRRLLTPPFIRISTNSFSINSVANN